LVKFRAEFLILLRITRISPRPAENENTVEGGFEFFLPCSFDDWQDLGLRLKSQEQYKELLTDCKLTAIIPGPRHPCPVPLDSRFRVPRRKDYRRGHARSPERATIRPKIVLRALAATLAGHVVLESCFAQERHWRQGLQANKRRIR